MRKVLLAVSAALLLAACGGSGHQAVTHKLHAGPSACQGGYETAYGCQAHPATFGVPPAGANVSPPTATSTPTVEMFDAVSVSAIPHGPRAVAGYLSGSWPTYFSLRTAFPAAIHIPVAIRATPVYPSLVGHMACLDVEPGDAIPSEAGAWARGELGLGVKPCLYANLSTMPAVRASLASAGVASGRVLLWVADWVFHPGLAAGFDADQWTDHGPHGENYDESTVSLAFLGLGAPNPGPVDIGGAQHYERYPDAKWAATHSRERNTIRTWDSHACQRPARRPVCRSSRAHMILLLGRDQAVYRRQTRAERDADHLPGRIQGLSRRLNNGRGVVRRWL